MELVLGVNLYFLDVYSVKVEGVLGSRGFLLGFD